MVPEKQIDIFNEQQMLQTFIESVEYRVARNREELEAAYALVYKEYLKRGYIKPDGKPLKLSIFNALPQTTTFIALMDNQLVATATVVPDSHLGLPMDKIYHEELCLLRQRSGKICEVSMLASDTEFFQNGVSMMLNAKKLFFIFNLFKIIFDYARELAKLDYFCITINPKHNLTYEYILFKDLGGGLKEYDTVNNAPALAKYLDLRSAKEECQKLNKPGLYQMFFVRRTHPENFACKAILSPADLKYFFVDKTDIFKQAASLQMAYLESCYPAYDFSKIMQSA
jgi:hypothetical protein